MKIKTIVLHLGLLLNADIGASEVIQRHLFSNVSGGEVLFDPTHES